MRAPGGGFLYFRDGRFAGDYIYPELIKPLKAERMKEGGSAAFVRSNMSFWVVFSYRVGERKKNWGELTHPPYSIK